MKNIKISTLILLFLGLNVLHAQVPQAFNYQAVARTSDGAAMANEAITIRIDIGGDPIEGLATEYSEEHAVTTNAAGLFSVVLGTGANPTGTLAGVNWGDGSKFISVAVMGAGGDFATLGTSQLVSVPYALMAGNVAGESGDGATDELQELVHDGDSISLSQSGGSVPDNVEDADADPTNELQQLSINENELSLSDGGSVMLPSGGSQMLTKDGSEIILTPGGGSVTDEVEDDDADPQNELQQISLSNNVLTLSDGGSVTLPDGGDPGDADKDPANEIQTLSKDGLEIILSQGGGSIMDAVDDADADDQNEIQELSINGSELRLSNGGGSVTLPSGGSQMLTKDGLEIILTPGGGSVMDAVEDDDADPQNELQTISKTGNTVSLSDGGGSFTDAVDDDDSDSDNEIQELSLSGNTLSLSRQGGSVDLPAGGSSPWTENGNEVSYPGFVSAIDGKATIYTTGNGNGELSVFGANGQTNVILGQSYSNQGAIALRNASNVTNVRAGAVQEAGFVDVFGTNGTINAQIGSDNRDRRCGVVHTFDHQGTRRASLYGCIIIERQHARLAPVQASAIVNDLKMCKMDHPTESGKEIWLTAMEGPEAGTYLRGQITLIRGEAEVEYPDHFLHTANVNGATITLTPHSAESLGLAAIERTAGGFMIKELAKGQGSYTVDWEVKAVRKGFEQMPVVRQKELIKEELIGSEE